MKTATYFLFSILVGGGLGVGLAFWTIGPAPVIAASAASATRKAGVELEDNPPVAIVDEQQHNFGTMLQGDTKTHDFIVSNKGGSPLVLAVGKTSCKCTLGDVANTPIPPGGSAPVKLEWIAKALPGPFRQLANLKTNDPQRPLIELSIEGEVVAARGLTPSLFDVGTVNADAGGEATVYVVAFERDDLAVTAAMTDSTEEPGRFSVSVEEFDPSKTPLADGKAASKIVVKLGAGMPIGPVNEWVAITTNLNGGEEFKLPITGRVRGAITIRGSAWNADAGVVNLGVVDGKQGRSVKLLLYCRGPHATETRFEVESVDPPELTVKLDQSRNVREGVTLTPLRVTVPPGTRPMVRMNKTSGGGTTGDGDGLLRIKSTHPASPEIRVPLRFVVQG